MLITEDGLQVPIGKAFITEEGKQVSIGKAFITENGVYRLLSMGGRGISEFLTYHNTNGYSWMLTDDGSSVKRLADGQTDMVWLRNNVMYRIKKVVDSNGYTNCILQKKPFETTSWTDIRSSGNSTTAYYLSYNKYDDVFVVTQVLDNINGESQSREGTTSIYYATVPGSNIESDSTIFTSLVYSWTSASLSVEFASMDVWQIPPTVYSHGDKFFLYMRYYMYSGGSAIYITGFKNGENAWYGVGAQSIGTTEPVLFNGSYFNVSSPFGYEPPTKITFSSGTSSPSYSTYTSISNPPGAATNTSGNGRAKFFLNNGKLVYIVVTKELSTSTSGTVQIYTSTDGSSFTLVRSNILPTLSNYIYNIIYLGETSETWNFLISTKRDSVTQQSNGAFYYINKSDYAVESEPPITIDGEPMYFGVTKYE